MTVLSACLERRSRRPFAITVATIACSFIAGQSILKADRPFFRATRKQSTVPAQSLPNQSLPNQSSPAIRPPSSPLNSEPGPTLAPAAPTLTTPPLTDAPRFTAPVVPKLKTPPLPLDPTPVPATPRTTPSRIVPMAPITPAPSKPQTITTRRAGSDPCLFIDVSCEFLNRLVSTPQQNAGPVNDWVLGAAVAGEQTTNSRVSIRTLPSPQTAKFDVLLGGETCTRTTATTPQAALDVKGRQRFDLQKSVEFDGGKFLTRSPGTRLDTSQQFLRARTSASQIPVVNSIAETIALNQANLRQPIARQETARRVTSRLTPEFNDRIDERLAAANQGLDRLSGTMPNVHQFLTHAQWSSTDRSLAGQLAGFETVTTPAPPARGGASLRIHESFAASLANATQLNGREITVEQIRQWIGDFDRDLSGSQSGGTSPLSAAGDASIRLADSQPVVATYQNGEIKVTLRASLKAGGLVELPIHQITIGYSIGKTKSSIELRPLPVTVISETSEAPGRSTVEMLIQSQIQNRLDPVTISPDAIPPLDNGMRPRVTDLVSENGWVTFVLD